MKELELTIASANVRWTIGAPMPILVRVSNRTAQPVDIPTFGGGNSVYFGMFLLDFDLTFSGDLVRMIRPHGAVLSMPAYQPVVIQAGGSWETTVDFSDWIPVVKEGLPEGRYELRARWQDARATGRAPLVSNVLALELRGSVPP